ncbi:DNA-directed RNA polymerase I subunit 2-like isoform X2 [Rosa chinensis]|uniref:DNA-directed RNA polymerase I subunit 2-like isoform X2 n=1 Tax=Rosa chinensis TaxID=74649 RepID=UPI000D096A73|nr:DNA-directed RNA polymerase I subunit 2-like isoform X2 [Rosa chinensis]XP_024189286.1 DNA-directed RNA polymerase I subunit 2-like isoform X2 [Rosa chinensis]XP_024189295.1 DNA-directed RNA polymerase I subunit 2-like isoform X2 [Rosa chinensis]XP_024189301.1 DNA-directed RNA polymerase I subunit 2-like isoform X2 [Rosa chinensis]
MQQKRRTSAGDLTHLRELFRHHIESFDYLITAGLGVTLRDIKPVQVHNPHTGETLRIWFADDPILGRPQKDRSSEPLYPFEAFIDTPDREIFASLTCCCNEKFEKEKGAVATQLVGERVQIIINEVADLGLGTHLQCLEHIGEDFQPLMGELENEPYSVVGDAVLKDYIYLFT